MDAKEKNPNARFHVATRLKNVLRSAIHILFVIVGIFSAGMGLKGFLLSSRFIDGGVTGISMLLSNVLGYPLAILISVINVPFILIGFRHLGVRFAVKSMLAIAGLSLCLAFIPYPDVTPDKLLKAVFGGFFIGAGIGLAIRGGVVLDGTEIVAVLISRGMHILKVGDVILALNIVIFSAAAFFLGVDSSLYSMLTYVAASKTVDFIIHGIEEYTAMTVISDRNEEIRARILHDLGIGVTLYKGERGHSGAEQDILMCVVTRLEVGGVMRLVKKVDADAFVMMHGLAGVEGGMVKKTPLH